MGWLKVTVSGEPGETCRAPSFGLVQLTTGGCVENVQVYSCSSGVPTVSISPAATRAV